MTGYEIDEALSTFRIVIDNREHITQQSKERYAAFGVPTERATLSYGDYCGNITLPSGSALYDTSVTIKAGCVVERKMSLDELAQCFTQGRERFNREFERAASVNAKTYLLVENGNFESIINHRYRSRFNPAAFMGSLTAWTARYEIVPIFCRAATSGTLIKELLFREMRERLERGEYG